MGTEQTANFLAGIIEGFYGQPWTQAERFELFDWMARWGLNTYFYAPKDDLKHRAIWRELYSGPEIEKFEALVRRCSGHGLHFVYGLSPGLDIRYGNAAEFDHLKKRFEQMLSLGCHHFSLLFDDIPDRMVPEDIKQWDSLASAQAHLVNHIFQWMRERSSAGRLLFCPTPYCGRMAERNHGGEDYLPTLGRELAPEIDVFWTGPEIISREITAAHAQELQKLLRRKPLIWDNLYANDYDGRRFYCGPYAGRPPELRGEISGVLVNPNNEFLLNYVPLRTFAEFVCGEGKWDARKEYLGGMKEWLPHFAMIGQPVGLEDLILFGDCYYLPHQEGTEAEALYQEARILLMKSPAEWEACQVEAFRARATRLREFCARMTELHDRALFYALSRRVWELREELDLLLGYVAVKLEKQDAPCRSDFHLPGTYRGGMVPRLQRLLTQQPDGSFIPYACVMSDCVIRPARPDDQPGAYYVCLKTGDYGKDGEPCFHEDPDALGRIFVGPYLAYEPELSLILEDEQGICGYALGAFDSRAFFARYDKEWRPALCARFPEPKGDPKQWTRVQHVYSCYHSPDYVCPEPYESYPSHLHIDLLERARGRGYGRRMLEQVMEKLRQRGSPGAHLGVSALNEPAFRFYQHLGFRELMRTGSGNDRVIYMGKDLRD